MVRKHLKKLMVTAMLVIGVVSSTLVSSAKSMNTYVDCPASTAGTWSNRTAAVALYGKYSTAQGKNAYVYLKSGVTLTTEFSKNSRQFVVKLMELDATGGDDTVKIYYGTFKDRKYTSITSIDTKIPGYIEAEGDSTAELYLKYYMGTEAFDDEKGHKQVPVGVFQYMFEMN